MRIIDNEGNPIRVESFEVPIAPSNEQLADAIDELEANRVAANKFAYTLAAKVDSLSARVDNMKLQLFWLNYALLFFWCCLVLYWVLK
jgi:hypothetical protein